MSKPPWVTCQSRVVYSENSADFNFPLYGEKIEMDYAVDLEGRIEERHTTTTMTTMDTHTYWTATANTVAAYPEPTQPRDDEPTDAVKDFGEDEDNHKFGLCNDCGCGLDDRSEFVVHTYTGGETALICLQCRRFPCPWNPVHYR